MRNETADTLRHLQDASWFSKVGVRDEDSNMAVVLSSWRDAVRHCQSVAWDNLAVDTAGRLREKILTKSLERLREWNDLAEDLKKHVLPLVRDKVLAVTEDIPDPDAVRHCCEWDILHLCLETE